MKISLYNTLTRRKDALQPHKADTIGMYVCGPTVYDRPHLGNARSVVVYDVLFRLLRHVYGESNVTFVRNITDVDDKINAAAIQRGISIQALTSEITAQFHADVGALNVLPPTIEPRATEHIPQMIAIIEKLIANGNAYVSEGHVLFAVTSASSNEAWQYGMLSGRKLDDLQAGARVEVESYKKHPGDFVLWKPTDAEDDPSSVFDSPWGKGRPGWHIECSAMSSQYLGDDFDIHGGGSDLMFPHHENEIAQSCCAHPHSHYAKLWVHNGFLTVNGEKMSKSLGNFITVHDLLERGLLGEIIRLTFLSVKYNEPLDWTDKLLQDAEKTLKSWYRATENTIASAKIPEDFIDALCDDMNVPKAIRLIHTNKNPSEIKAMAQFLGLLQMDARTFFQGTPDGGEEAYIDSQIQRRKAAKTAKNWAESDRIRDALKARGILLEDNPDGSTIWRKA